ncbi:MAG TPA: hypothetical protein DHU55_14785 [Blastocatellia bacterium]|nr:hypothetical protein [Blastocatellia bacterium]
MKTGDSVSGRIRFVKTDQEIKSHDKGTAAARLHGLESIISFPGAHAPGLMLAPASQAQDHAEIS